MWMKISCAAFAPKYFYYHIRADKGTPSARNASPPGFETGTPHVQNAENH
jgi:hypothetical protein